ncbi:intracellular protein transport protein USO1-like [Trichogramma pretiosum]|uniref:intracellular protein transport protein USO1-like n=1 Tax=Trichogramma pretiosum TaxID=7493 RepID=UPI000C71B18A|nr:intracellular protein transport protein USO1-like [Trichogramma pretiosum]
MFTKVLIVCLLGATLVAASEQEVPEAGLREKFGNLIHQAHEKLHGRLSANQGALSGIAGKIREQRIKLVEFAKEKLVVLKQRYEVLKEKLQSNVNQEAIRARIQEVQAKGRDILSLIRARAAELKLKIKEAIKNRSQPQHVEALQEELVKVEEVESIAVQYSNEVVHYSAVGDKISQILSSIHEKFHEVVANNKDKIAPIVEKVREEAKKIFEAAKVKAAELREKLAALKEKLLSEENKAAVKAKIEELKVKGQELVEKVKAQLEELRQKVKEHIAKYDKQQ